ncbi:sushi repeat (SCR repeat) domain-containing protein [Ditylenchus destructor]|uniref:Sushi repeat (SCR repeat) domain-containing protein n=1 Tax=Ditylenchus destructor TaxID=166010 RepID=A0AAD4RAH0_9BILA|nr:sushi repeat (SCR repeat) domain-containing protein [Ditylenchus destructor]
MNSIYKLLFCVLMGLTGTTVSLSTIHSPLNGTTKMSAEKHEIQKRQLGTGIACTPLTALNGVINYMQTNPSLQYSSGTTALLQCNIGYTVSGSSSAVCNNGIWSPTIGTCIQGGFGGITTFPGSFGTGGACLAMLAPLNGHLSYSTGGVTGPFTSGTSVSVICNGGFTISGSQSAVCQSGTWQPAILGSCIQSGSTIPGTIGFPGSSFGSGVQCPAAPQPFNGQVQYSGVQNGGMYPSGTTATLTCNMGNFVSGSSTSTCSNGIWTPSFGICTSSSLGTGLTGTPIGFGTGTQCLFPISPPIGGSVQYSTGSTTGPYSEGSSATLICNGGTSLGSSTSICQSGQWQPSMFAGCSNTGMGINNGFGTTGAFGQQCLAPLPAVVGGIINYSQGTQFGPFNQGTSATLQCTNGQQATGSLSSTCNGGFWQPAILGPCGGLFGTTMSGFNTGLNGQQCAMGLLAPLNGRITYSQSGSSMPLTSLGPYTQGTTATLSCNPGFFVVGGQSTAICQNGMFQPSTLGTCSSTGTFNPTDFSGSNASMNNTCYNFPQPEGGQISYSPVNGGAPYPIGTVASLVCEKGFVSNGSTFTNCQSTGWSPSSLGQCKQGITSIINESTIV